MRRGDLPKREARTAIEIALGPITALAPMEELHTRALELAVELGHTVYDCFYLALAERERVPFVCADGPLMNKAKKLREIEVRAL